MQQELLQQAIEESFGVLANDEDFEEPWRGEDERSRYLARLWELRSSSIATY
jgi:hypothetical protein